VPCRRIEVVEAAHPVPDERGAAAAARILDLVRGLGHEDMVVCLFSGGGSALLSAPAPGISLQDKQAVNEAMLRSGATIEEINCVRKHLSAIKGGRLAAAAHPARVVTFLISDVPGDDPSVIASGPTVPDPTTFADAVAVLAARSIEAPPAVSAHLRAGAVAARPQLVIPLSEADASLSAAAPGETPKPGDVAFAGDDIVMLATARDALTAACGVARRAGLTTLVLGDAIEGEARDVATAHARLALALARDDRPSAMGDLHSGLVRFASRAPEFDPRTRSLPEPPCVVISGGETTVTVRGSGRGGRNTEYALALALALGERAGIAAIAADTDGIDGTRENAGAIVLPDTLQRARQAGIDPVKALVANDAYSVFAGTGDLVVTGPTLTNVNDFRAILIRH
jgi:glycerate 2-kinase